MITTKVQELLENRRPGRPRRSELFHHEPRCLGAGEVGGVGEVVIYVVFVFFWPGSGDLVFMFGVFLQIFLGVSRIYES